MNELLLDENEPCEICEQNPANSMLATKQHFAIKNNLSGDLFHKHDYNQIKLCQRCYEIIYKKLTLDLRALKQKFQQGFITGAVDVQKVITSVPPELKENLDNLQKHNLLGDEEINEN